MRPATVVVVSNTPVPLKLPTGWEGSYFSYFSYLLYLLNLTGLESIGPTGTLLKWSRFQGTQLTGLEL